MTTENTISEDFAFDVTAKLRTGESGEVALQNVILGAHPVVLIESDYDLDSLDVSIDATGFTQKELGAMLGALTYAVKNAPEVSDD